MIELHDSLLLILALLKRQEKTVRCQVLLNDRQMFAYLSFDKLQEARYSSCKMPKAKR